jgi:hypothetical protein
VDELGNVKERAMEVLKLGYEQALLSPSNVATMDHIGPKLDPPLYSNTWEDRREFRRLAQYLNGRKYIESVADGLLWFRFTPKGRALVEGENQKQTHISSTYTQNIAGNAYNPMMGELRNINISSSFDMRTVEAEIDRSEEEAKRSGAPEAEQIQELLAELREHLRSGEPIEMGWLARYRKVCQDNPYLSSPVISVLLNHAFGGALTS